MRPSYTLLQGFKGFTSFNFKEEWLDVLKPKNEMQPIVQQNVVMKLESTRPYIANP
jgi:hypothetical protein